MLFRPDFECEFLLRPQILCPSCLVCRPNDGWRRKCNSYFLTVVTKFAVIPALLASSGLHHHLTKRQERGYPLYETGEPREVQRALLLGFGADMIWSVSGTESVKHMIEVGDLTWNLKSLVKVLKFNLPTVWSRRCQNGHFISPLREVRWGNWCNQSLVDDIFVRLLQVGVLVLILVVETAADIIALP